jgi:hypothetical protein
MKVGVCAWGSLLWDPRNLKLRGDFLPIGPCLPLEFSRISGPDERRRLTLVIDEEDGAPCQSFVGQSAFSDIGDAIDNLAAREGLYYKGDVGWAAPGAASARALSRHPSAVQDIQEFLDQSDFDAIVWTALPSNFAARLPDGAAFSVPRALRVLSDDFSQSEWCASIEYMRRAPSGVVTPLRAAVEGVAWAFARWGGGS